MGTLSIITLIITIILVIATVMMYVLHARFASDASRKQDINYGMNIDQNNSFNEFKKNIYKTADEEKKRIDNEINTNKVRASVVNSIATKNKENIATLDDKITDLTNSTESEIANLKKSISGTGSTSDIQDVDTKVKNLDIRLTGRIDDLSTDLTNMQGSATFNNVKLNSGGTFTIGDKSLREYVVGLIDEQLGGNTETFIEHFTEHLTQAPAAGALVKTTNQNSADLKKVGEEMNLIKEKVNKVDEQDNNKIALLEKDIYYLRKRTDNNRNSINSQLAAFQQQYNTTVNRFMNVLAKDKAAPLALENQEKIEKLNKSAQEALDNLKKSKQELIKGFTTTKLTAKNIETTDIRRTKGDWLRIHGTRNNGTAMYNGVQINTGGGLTIGSWARAPQGNIYTSGGKTSEIKHPNGQTKINSYGIMLGGDNKGKETNSAQISAGLHKPNSLNIVGMSKDKNYRNRQVDIWAEGGLKARGNAEVTGRMDVGADIILKGNPKKHNNNWRLHNPADGRKTLYIARNHGWKNGMSINGVTGQVTANNFTSTKGVSVTKDNPGPLIEKRYGNNAADRYGVSQEGNGTVHLYAANSHGPASINLSYATGEGKYKPALTVKKDNGKTVVNITAEKGLKAKKIALGNKFLLSGVGDKHANDGWLRIFNNKGTDYYGGLAAGRLWSKTDISARTELCIGRTCINEADLKILKGKTPITISNPKGYALQYDNISGKGNARYSNKNRGPMEQIFINRCNTERPGQDWCSIRHTDKL